MVYGRRNHEVPIEVAQQPALRLTKEGLGSISAIKCSPVHLGMDDCPITSQNWKWFPSRL